MSDPKNIIKKCKLELSPCVWVYFKGDTTGKFFPESPNDDGLLVEFLHWCSDNNIYPVRGTPGTSGGGIYAHAHYVKDAGRIALWFENKGLINTSEVVYEN
jgi:hypothetical protein